MRRSSWTRCVSLVLRPARIEKSLSWFLAGMGSSLGVIAALYRVNGLTLSDEAVAGLPSYDGGFYGLAGHPVSFEAVERYLTAPAFEKAFFDTLE